MLLEPGQPLHCAHALAAGRCLRPRLSREAHHSALGDTAASLLQAGGHRGHAPALADWRRGIQQGSGRSHSDTADQTPTSLPRRRKYFSASRAARRPMASGMLPTTLSIIARCSRFSCVCGTRRKRARGFDTVQRNVDRHAWRCMGSASHFWIVPLH